MLLEKSFKIQTEKIYQIELFIYLTNNILSVENKLHLSYRRIDNPEKIAKSISKSFHFVNHYPKNRYIIIENILPSDFEVIINLVLNNSDDWSEIIFSVDLSDSEGEHPDCIRICYENKQVINNIWFELNHATPERIAQIQSWVKYPLKYMSQMGDW
jgi:hypothetical protein